MIPISCDTTHAIVIPIQDPFFSIVFTIIPSPYFGTYTVQPPWIIICDSHLGFSDLYNVNEC